MAEELENIPETPAEEKFVHPLDRMLAEEEAEIEKVIHPEHPTEDEGVDRPLVEAEKPEEPPVEEPPVETPPIEEPPEEPPVEEPPKEQKAQPKERPWSQLRQAQREKRALEEEKTRLERELQQYRVQQEPIVEEEEIQDPLTRLSREIEETKQEIARQKTAELARTRADAVRREEEAFRHQHADYDDAVHHIERVQRKEFELSGQLEDVASDLIRKYPDEIEKQAQRFSKDERELANDLAFAILLDQRKANFVQRNAGRVASAAYELAQNYGYQAKPPPAANGNGKPADPASRERVLRAKGNQALSQSISGMQSAGGSRDQPITSRAQLLAMSTVEQDAYIDHMDRVRPGWDKELK